MRTAKDMFLDQNSKCGGPSTLLCLFCVVLVWFGLSFFKGAGRKRSGVFVCFKFRLTVIPWIEHLCEAGSCAPRALSQFYFIHKHHQWSWLGDLLQKFHPGLSYIYTMHVHVFVYLQKYIYIPKYIYMFLCLCMDIVRGFLIPCIPCRLGALQLKWASHTCKVRKVVIQISCSRMMTYSKV